MFGRGECTRNAGCWWHEGVGAALSFVGGGSDCGMREGLNFSELVFFNESI